MCGFRKGNGNYLSLTGSVVVFWSSDSEYLLLCREICSLGFIFRATRTISRHSQWKAADQCFRVQGSQKKKLRISLSLPFWGSYVAGLVISSQCLHPFLVKQTMMTLTFANGDSFESSSQDSNYSRPCECSFIRRLELRKVR